jgi:hypothetical protein
MSLMTESYKVCVCAHTHTLTHIHERAAKLPIITSGLTKRYPKRQRLLIDGQFIFAIHELFAAPAELHNIRRYSCIFYGKQNKISAMLVIAIRFDKQ